MDCEKFDRVVLDLLYDELDELTTAAARRHMDHCARCGPIGNGLRATREIGVLPALASPSDLRARILEAERSARADLALRQRVGRTISVLAGYAMRPQLAMAAVLILMVGMSLMLLQPQPGSRDSMSVTERGVPEVDTEALAETPLDEPAASPEPSRGIGQAHGPFRGDSRNDQRSEEVDKGKEAKKKTTTASPFEAAMDDFRAGRYPQSRAAFEAIAAQGGKDSAQAELMAARAARYANGCDASVALLENVSARHPGTSVAHEADWFAAACYRDLGRTAQASQKLAGLRDVPGYSERARNVLDQLSAGTTVAARQAAAQPKTAAKPAAAAPPAAAAAEPPKPTSTVDLDAAERTAK